MSSTLLLLPFVASSILLLLLLIAGPSPSNSQMASGIAAPAAVSRSPARRLLGVKNVSPAVMPVRKIAPAVMPAARNRWAAVVSRAHQQQKARSRVAAAGPIRPRAPIVQASPPAAAADNMIKQCACEDIRPCKERYLQSLSPCLEACQDRLAVLGGNVKRVRQCFEQKRQILKYAISCTENSYKNSCAARRLPVQMIPKRYGREDTLKAYIDTEIRQMVARMGLQREAKPLIQAGEQLFACAKRCMTHKSASCEKQLKCGLSLPAEKELVQTSKQCAIQGGLTTANMQELCRCSAAAGVKSLAGNVCSRIIIS